MSSKAKLTAITFTGTATKSVAYGFILEDEYGKVFDDSSESQIEDDIALLNYVMGIASADYSGMEDTRDSIKDILDCIYEHQYGIEINGVYYDFDEIKQVWGEQG